MTGGKFLLCPNELDPNLSETAVFEPFNLDQMGTEASGGYVNGKVGFVTPYTAVVEPPKDDKRGARMVKNILAISLVVLVGCALFR